MEYKTELHCHSRDASGCSSESAEGIVRKYTEAGYTTVCLTNHFCPDSKDDDDAAWEAKVDKLYRAYDILTEAAGLESNPMLALSKYNAIYGSFSALPLFLVWSSSKFISLMSI